MSDRETVTLDLAQYEGLKAWLGAVSARLGPEDAQLSLHQVLTKIERTLYDGLRAIAQGGTDNSQVLQAINNLDRKVSEFMATQEERLQAILVSIQNVKQMLADLKVNNPAIEDEITAIETELAPAPAPDTGGGTGEGGGEPVPEGGSARR